MKIVNELKKLWLGIVIGYLSMPVWCSIYDGRMDHILDEYVLTETMLLCISMAILSILATWIGRILYTAIKNEVIDISTAVKKSVRKEVA